jgi:hypothetical protein
MISPGTPGNSRESDLWRDGMAPLFARDGTARGWSHFPLPQQILEIEPVGVHRQRAIRRARPLLLWAIPIQLDAVLVGIAQLKREVAKLKAERDILKKAAAYFAKEST